MQAALGVVDLALENLEAGVRDHRLKPGDLQAQDRWRHPDEHGQPDQDPPDDEPLAEAGSLGDQVPAGDEQVAQASKRRGGIVQAGG